ncbi:MAG: glycosyltransferase family 4 protein [Candidatus Helarchaeota archaeon]
MHICIFLENTHPNNELNLKVGGIENQVLELLKEYQKIRNLKVSLITKFSEFKILSKNIKIYQIHKFKNYIIDTFYFLIRSFFKVIKINKRDHIDIINIHHYGNLNLFPIIFRLIFKIPILMKLAIDFESHIMDVSLIKKHKYRYKVLNYSQLKFFLKFLIKKVNFIRAINSKMYDDLINLGYPKERILRIPNGISPDKFVNLNKDLHRNTHFGYIGRLIEFKNLRFLLNTFKLYLNKYPNDKLFFYGIGPEATYILEFIKRNKLERNIFLCGFEKNKKKIFSNIDVLIDPSFSQGISNSNLEGMASSTFIIASNVPGNKDLIIHKKTGLLFNPYNQNDLLNQLRFYKTSNYKVIAEILENANIEIKNRYDINKIAHKIYDFLKRHLNS